ncbi:MAG: hypothetical protein RXR65_01160 [Hydrogenobaculum sp.]
MINICKRIQKQFIYNDKMHIDKSSTKYKLTFTYLKQGILGGAQQLLFSVNEEKEKTIELAEDLVAIVTSFAAKYTEKEDIKTNDNSTMLA